MTQQEINRIAKFQSAIDLSCQPADFDRKENILVSSRRQPGARRYLELPFACNLVTYGRNIVASAAPALHAIVSWYINAYPAVHCFETPHMQVLNDRLGEKGFKVCFMAEYFLPSLSALRPLPSPYPILQLEPPALADFYQPQWSNALCEKRKELDVLVLAAYDRDQPIALAGASADCNDMWQIGVDVLPAYRRQGVAAALTSRLALEILRRGKVPFYCAAWSNIGSVRNAIKSGFRPAWVEMTAKSAKDVDAMNQPALGHAE